MQDPRYCFRSIPSTSLQHLDRSSTKNDLLMVGSTSGLNGYASKLVYKMMRDLERKHASRSDMIDLESINHMIKGHGTWVAQNLPMQVG